MSDGPLPDDVRLVHIGVPKTGTTALQGAFHRSRERMAEHGVHYAGKGRQAILPALAISRGRGLKGAAKTSPQKWQDLVDEVEAAGDQRVVIDSEFFTDADDLGARRVVDELGRDRVQIVITLRPLAKILSSQWQQYVQN